MEFTKQGKEIHMEIQKLKRVEEELEVYKTESKVVMQFISKIEKSFKYRRNEQIVKEELPDQIQANKISALFSIVIDLIKNKEEL